MAPRKLTSQKSSEKGEATEPLKEAEDGGALEVFLPTPPDGGWGWVIVLASVVANVIVDGITYTFGIFLPKFQQAFQQPKSTIALAGSMQVGTYLCAGPIVSALTNRYGCKKVTMIGSLVATAGFILSVFAPSADILILTYGIVAGFGFGMMYLPAIVIVGYYFEKRRALATGIAVCGSGIGMFILAPVSDWLLQEFGLKGSLLILAGFVLNGVLCGALFRPLPDPRVTGDAAEASLANKPIFKPSSLPENGSSGGDVKTPALSATHRKPPAIVVLDDGKTPATLRPAIQILDGNGSSGNQGGGTVEEASFGVSASMPSVVYSSAKDKGAEGKLSLTPVPAGPRQRCNTLDPADRIRLRHVEAVQHRVDEESKAPMTPIGLSYIGVSDAHLNKIRASTHLLALSRREIGVGSGMLFISDHNVHQSALRSVLSVNSRLSVKSQVGKVLCSCLPESVQDTLLQMLDFSILKNKAYDLILLGNIFAMLGFYVPFVFMHQKALDMGIGDAKAAILLSIIGITNTVGRVLTGVLANLNKIDSLVINNIAMLLCGVATFVTPFCDNYILLCFIAAVFGLCVAAYISLSSILLCDMLGVEQLTNAFGFLTLARGISSCAGSPMAGAIIDATNDVDLAFFVGGALIVLGSLMHFLLHTPCINHKKLVAQTKAKRTHDMDMP